MLFRRAPTVLRPGSHDLAVSLALATLPQPLIAGLLRRMTRGLPQHYPKLAARMAELKGKRLLIVPDELPYAFLLDFPEGRFSIDLTDPEQAPPTDAQMRGPLRLFYDLGRGGRDGDALFFSRELAVTGDMAAAVTLRNAMDGAGVDLFAEFLDLPGPLGPLVRGAGAAVDRWAGILLGPLAERAARLEGDVAALRSEVRRAEGGRRQSRGRKPVSALAAVHERAPQPRPCTDEAMIPEIVAPGGTPAALVAAIDAGADTVYCGFRDATNARNYPGLNFTADDLKEGIAYAHARGRKVNVAINTYASAGNTKLWHAAIDTAASAGRGCGDHGRYRPARLRRAHPSEAAPPPVGPGRRVHRGLDRVSITSSSASAG